MADEEEVLVDDPVDPYEPETESALDEGTEEEPPAPLVDPDEDDAGVPDDVADGELADPPVEDPLAGEDLAPLPESWAELDPEAVDLPDAEESEDTIADEVDALDDYDPLEITPDEDEPEPEPVVWDAYEIQAREANTLGDFFQVALTDDPDATSVAITTLEPGATYDIRIRGVKADGSTSGWSDTETIVLPVDQIPPPQPSAPVVVGVPGGFVVSHNGLTSTGDAQPTDYAETVLWAKRGASGTPMVVDRFTGPFNITYNSLETVLMVWWVTTVDKAGNASVKSGEASGQAQELIDEAGLRDKLDRLSTGEDLIADSVAAYIGEFLHLEAAQLDANEIWSNSAWLGQAKFESEVSGNRVLIDSNGIVLGPAGSSAGVALTRTGFSARDTNGDARFFLNALNGNVVMQDAVITAGQYRSASSGRRVIIDSDGVRAINADGSTQARFGSPADSNSLAIRSPDGDMRQIGAHIYGSRVYTGLPTAYANVQPGTTSAYGDFYGATPSPSFEVASNRYRVEVGFYFRGMVDAQGQTTYLNFQIVPATQTGTLLSGTLLSKYLTIERSPIYDTFYYGFSSVEDLPASVAVGDTIRVRWQIRARNFATYSTARPQITNLSFTLTPA